MYELQLTGFKAKITANSELHTRQIADLEERCSSMLTLKLTEQETSLRLRYGGKSSEIEAEYREELASKLAALK